MSSIHPLNAEFNVFFNNPFLEEIPEPRSQKSEVQESANNAASVVTVAIATFSDTSR